MRRYLPFSLFLLVVGFFILSCAGSQPRISYTEEELRAQMKILKISEPDKWLIETPDLTGGYPYKTDYKLRGICNGNEIESFQIRIYVVATRSDAFPIYRYDKWYNLKSAEDIDGKVLVLNEAGLEIGPVNVEHYIIPVDRDYLESHRAEPILVKLTGEGGVIEVNISPQAVTVFLKVLGDHLTIQ